MKQEGIIRMAREAGFETEYRKGKIHGFDRDGDYTDELKAFAALVAAAAQKDAARYLHIKGMARAMSLDMGGNHYWHMGLRDIRGPNLDEAIDRAIKAEGQA